MRRKAVLAVSAILLLLLVVTSGCGYRWHDFDTYAKWLKEDSDFESAERVELNAYYEIGSQVCNKIAEEYNIAEIAGEGSAQDKTLNVLKWVSDNIKHDGSQMVSLDNFNFYTLLEYGFGTGKGMNCYCLALVMTGCIEALGIKARTVILMPKEYDTGDNHVVTHVYLEEEDRWIMVDPSWNGYFSDEDGKIMNVFEVREAFANGKTAILNSDANHNGSAADESYYKKYMAKNLYWFKIILGDGTYYCAPSGFNLTDWHVGQAEWYIQIGMEVEDGYVENTKKMEYVNLNKEDFLKP